MSRRSRIITSVLTVLFAITAAGALTAYAENMDEGPGGQSGYSEEQGNQGGNDGDSGSQGGGSEGGGSESGGGSDSGSQGGGSESGGSDYQPQRDYGNDNDYSGDSDNDSDRDYSNRGSNNNYDDDDSGSDSYYDMDGNRYSNSSEIYVGGDQTYTPPVTVPETTAALYDTSSTKVDNRTLTNSDWKDIQAKLTEASNNANAKDADTGDFAFIQKNTEVEDNGHWMLILGFALIILSVIGFVILIAHAGERKRVPVYSSSRTAPRYRSEKTQAVAAADAKADEEPQADADADVDADMDADIDADTDAGADTKPEPAKQDKAPEKPKKRSKKGTRYRK
jgi:hypothetical protein